MFAIDRLNEATAIQPKTTSVTVTVVDALAPFAIVPGVHGHPNGIIWDKRQTITDRAIILLITNTTLCGIDFNVFG
jgi:hypothetical protein